MCRKTLPLLFSVVSVASVVKKSCHRMDDELNEVTEIARRKSLGSMPFAIPSLFWNPRSFRRP